MRIVHTCLRYPPATGGVETYVRDMVENTRSVEEQRDVRVLTSRMRTHGPVTELDPNTLLDDPPYIQRLHYSKTPFVSYPRLQALSYYLGHHSPDIIHAYSYWYQPADVAARYAAKHNKPFIFHPMYYENEVRSKPIWQLYKQTYGRKVFKAADIVAVISPYEQELIEKSGFPVKRFELLPPGVVVSDFEKTYANPFAARNITGPVLLTVSRLAEGKGLNDIISAFPNIQKTVPNAQLVIIGEDFGAKTDLQTAAGTNPNIHFIGKLSDAELRAAYQHAQALVHPTHYEAFGIVLAEAQAAKTPVIARNVAAVPFAAPEQAGGLLFTTQEELIEKCILVLTNENLRRTKGEAGHAYVASNFSHDVLTAKLLKLYKEITPKL